MSPHQLKMSQEIADELEERFSEERDCKSVPFTLLSFFL
jgi:Fe-S-cluster formation regulator IscX/YfhJ